MGLMNIPGYCTEISTQNQMKVGERVWWNWSTTCERVRSVWEKLGGGVLPQWILLSPGRATSPEPVTFIWVVKTQWQKTYRISNSRRLYSGKFLRMVQYFCCHYRRSSPWWTEEDGLNVLNWSLKHCSRCWNCVWNIAETRDSKGQNCMQSF